LLQWYFYSPYVLPDAKPTVTSIEGFGAAAASYGIDFCSSSLYLLCSKVNQTMCLFESMNESMNQSFVSCCLTKLSSAAQSKTYKP